MIDGITQLIKDKTREFHFTGKADFDSFELREITSAFSRLESFESVIDDETSSINSAMDEIEKERDAAAEHLQDALTLAEINDLPAHFIASFAEKINQALENLKDLSEYTENARVNCESLTAQIYSNNTH